MADKKINEFNEGELVKILGLDSNGNSLKEELASIISRGLSPYLILKDYKNIGKGTDLNNLNNGAYFYFIEAGQISNSPGFERFILLQLSVGSFGAQIAFAVIDKGIKWRTNEIGSEWQSWNAISFT